MLGFHAPQLSDDSFDHESGIALVQRHSSNPEASKQPSSTYSEVSHPHIPAFNLDRSLPSIDKWPTHLGKLRKDTWDHVQNILPNIIMILIPLPMLVLAALAVHLNGRLVDDQDWKHFQRATSTAVTLFPIIFALVVGRSVRAGAAWKLERSITLGHLEQLMGSQTIGGTVTTHFVLRSFNFAGLGLFVLWILSPIGGQSSLHLLSVTSQPLATVDQLVYLDTNTTTTTSLFDYGADFHWGIPALDTLYNSALSAPRTIKSSSMDLWGNVKIPNLSRLQASNAVNATGWTDVPIENVSYSSLLGIPVLNIPLTGTANFTIETSYWDFDCFNISKADKINTSLPSTTFHGTEFNESPLNLAMDHFCENGIYGGLGQTTGGQCLNSTPQTLLYQSKTWDNDDKSNVAYCSIHQAYVEAAITCIGTSKLCKVTSLRDSLLSHPATTLTPLLYSGCFFNMAKSLYAAGFQPHDGTSSLSELYMVEPDTPLAHSNRLSDIMISYTLPKIAFEERLGHVLNTYYIGSLVPQSFLGGSAIDSGPNLTTTATVVNLRSVYACNYGWVFLFTACTLVMLVSAIIGALLIHDTLNPDILGYCSTMTRDSPYIRLPPGGNTLGGAARARLLRSLKMRMGDVGSEEGLGHIALAPIDQAARVAKDKSYI